MISVIIPLEGRSKHLFASLDSVCKQKTESMEILIVPVRGNEDISDLEEEIVQGRELVSLLPACGSLAEAINLGVVSAKGEFVHFCSGRELLQSGAYDEILRQMTDVDADIACFGWEDYMGAEMCSAGFNGTGNMQAFAELIFTDSGMSAEYSGYGSHLWNKIFRRSVFFLEDTLIPASDEALGVMEPIWLCQLAIQCKKAVFTASCLMKRLVPTFENVDLDSLDIPAYFGQKKRALANAERISPHAYKLMLQLFFSHEIRLLLCCREAKFVKAAAAIEMHLLDFYGVPYEEKQVIQTFIRSAHQQKVIDGLRHDISVEYKKVQDLTNQAISIKADRTFLKNKTERQTKRIEGLEADRTFLKNKTERQTKRIEGLEADRTFLKNKTERQTKKIEGLEADRTFLKNKTERQTKKIEGLEADRTFLKNKTERQTKKIEGLEADRTFLKNKTERQTKKIEGLEADRTFLKNKTERQTKKIEGLEADRTFLKNKTERQTKKIEGLEADRTFLKNKTERQTKKIEGLEADRTFLKNKTERQTKKIEGLEADRTFLKNKTERQTKKIEGLEADRTFLKNKTERQTKKIEGLEADRAFLKRKSEGQLQKIEMLEKNNTGLLQQNTELELALAEFQGSFLARTALKLNRLYRKMKRRFRSIYEKMKKGF